MAAVEASHQQRALTDAFIVLDFGRSVLWLLVKIHGVVAVEDEEVRARFDEMVRSKVKRWTMDVLYAFPMAGDSQALESVSPWSCVL